MGIPEWLEYICIKKTDWNNISLDEQKSYNIYLMNLWLSMEPNLIELTNEIQIYQVPPRDHYNFLKNILPKKKLYLRWIRAKKKIYSSDVINILSSFYSISSREILENIDILSEQKIITILKQTGLQDKTINKMIKNG